MPNPKPALDHLILFLPAHPTSPTPLIPPSLTDNFTTTPGGTHADNLTSNTLILLADGCYIELITFLPPPSSTYSTTSTSSSEHATKIQNHWWGPSTRRTGWTDWCLTNALSPSSNHANVQRSHAPPISGARLRPDGLKVEWAVTFPQGERGGQARRGLLPFFCHDVTPRGVRVPLTPDSTEHVCGAVGVRSLTVLVDSSARLEEVCGVYVGLFGEAETVREGEEMVFELGRVVDVEGIGGGARVAVRVARGEEEKGRVLEKGFWVGDVVVAARASGERKKGRRERIDGEKEGIGGLWMEYV